MDKERTTLISIFVTIISKIYSNSTIKTHFELQLAEKLSEDLDEQINAKDEYIPLYCTIMFKKNNIEKYSRNRSPHLFLQ